MKNVRCILRVMTEIMISKDTAEIIQKHFDSLLDRYQEGLEQSIKGSGLYMTISKDNIAKVIRYVSDVVDHT